MKAGQSVSMSLQLVLLTQAIAHSTVAISYRPIISYKCSYKQLKVTFLTTAN